jgi:hypothetical protein
MLLVSEARAEAPKSPRPVAPAPDPLAVLREDGRSWAYETAFGESLSSLAVQPQGIRWLCEVKPWTAPGAVTRSSIACDLYNQAPDGPETGADWTIWLVFDDVGVRQLDGRDADVGDRSKTRALTFPRKLAGTWKLDEKGRDGERTVVTVHEATAKVRGVARKVWVAETERWAAPVGGKVAAPERELVQFVPGLGPVLMCTKQAEPGATYDCLRLFENKAPETKPTPETKPAPPQGHVSISSKHAHDPSTLKAEDVAAKAASSYLGGVLGCYRVVLARRPTTRAALTLGFTVSSVGKTEAISVEGGGDDGIAGCVAKLVAAWRFPIPQSTYAEPRNARFTLGLALTP